MLIGVMQAIATAGLVVLRDISVASIDDSQGTAVFASTLTTVRQPIKAMAVAALEHLLARIDGDDGPPRHEVMAPELVIREACAQSPFS